MEYLRDYTTASSGNLYYHITTEGCSTTADVSIVTGGVPCLLPASLSDYIKRYNPPAPQKDYCHKQRYRLIIISPNVTMVTSLY